MDDLSEYFINLGNRLIKIGEEIKNNEQDKIKKKLNKKLFTIAKKALKFIDENFPELNKPEIKQVTGASNEAINFNIFGDFSRQNMEEMHAELNVFIVEELLYIVKSHRLSGISSRDKNTLINYIIDNVRKRTKDVFINEDKK